MARPPTTFPVGETIGVFVGIVSWELLAEGRIEIIKALLITIPCALVWYGVRYWFEQVRNK
jgi:hypothetical protein